MFVFLLALGEDYNILVISTIREEAASGDEGTEPDPEPATSQSR